MGKGLSPAEELVSVSPSVTEMLGDKSAVGGGRGNESSTWAATELGISGGAWGEEGLTKESAERSGETQGTQGTTVEGKRVALSASSKEEG